MPDDNIGRKPSRPMILEEVEERRLNTLKDRGKDTSGAWGDCMMLREISFLGGAYCGTACELERWGGI